jgi:Lrp/AsnC family leucine-responsive transcriptional regulator
MSSEKLPSGAHLDEVDLNIIKHLSQDAKLPYAELGKKIHLTAPAVHGRVKKLEKLGIITRYKVELDYSKIGFPVTTYVRAQTGKVSCRETASRLEAFAEIEECHSVAGEDDVLMKIRTSTPLELQILLDKLRTKGIIEKSVSILVLETHFDRSRI